MHYGTYRTQQKGVSLSGLLMWSVVLVMVAILGMKLAPAYIEYASIQKALVSIASDPDFKDATPRQIRESFQKRSQIDDIREVTGKDIEIKKENKQRTLEINYSVIVPVVANISLFIEFNATSH